MGRPRLKIPVSDRIGKKIGSWTIIELSKSKRYVGKNSKVTSYGKTTISWYYKCICDCGIIKEVFWGDLCSGKSLRCRECANKMFLLDSQKGIRNFGKDNPNYRGSKDIPGRLFSRARHGANIRDINFEITLKDMQKQWEKQKGLCYYTGLPLIFLKEKETSDTGNNISLIGSLDRIDSSKGYSIGNIAWVSKTVNYIKMDLPHELFLKTCEMVYEYHMKKVANEQQIN